MEFILGNACMVIPYEMTQAKETIVGCNDVKIKVCGSLLATNYCDSKSRNALLV
jgi:hypothetical protein